MSTYPIDAAEAALVVRYLVDHAAADVLARALLANRAACEADGWKLGRDMTPAPTATDILAAAPMRKPARVTAARVIDALRYNSASNRADHLPADVAAELDALYLRILDGCTWQEVDAVEDEDERSLLGMCLTAAKRLRARRAA